jgi:hypothetical protein
MMKRTLLFTAIFAIIVPAMASATLQGISRISDFTILNDGSFAYNNSITLYNDQDYADYLAGAFRFYTEDLSSIASSGITWTGAFTAFSSAYPWQPGTSGIAYARSYEIWVDAYSSMTYSFSYLGTAGFWDFGGDEGIYYGDGIGGAETPFDDFYFTLTLPGNATDFTILDQSSPYSHTGTNPFVLDWHENGVWGLTANISFSGPQLDPSIPEPGTLALLGLGLMGLPLWRRFRK